MRGPNVGLDHDPARISGRLRTVAPAAAAASLAAVAAPALGQTPARLPSTVAPPAPGPPLTSSTPPLELRFPGRIASRQRVLVELGPTGVPAAVRVRQRLVVQRTGDYSISVQGPVTSVARAPGSESDPGGRAGLLLWQGFSPGRRVLAADVELGAREAARFLPLRFRVRRRSGRRELVIWNATPALANERSFTGRIGPAHAAGALDELRAALRAGRPAGDQFVSVEGLEPGARLRLEVPMRVSGTVRVGERARTFSRLVRGDRPLVLPLGPTGRVQLTATARPVPPLAALQPPGASSWSVAAQAGRVRGGARLLDLALRTRLQAARYRQYSQFLANPDRLGSTRAVYVFRSAPARAARAAVTEDGGGSVLPVVLALVVGILGAGLAAVWWAHS